MRLTFKCTPKFWCFYWHTLGSFSVIVVVTSLYLLLTLDPNQPGSIPTPNSHGISNGGCQICQLKSLTSSMAVFSLMIAAVLSFTDNMIMCLPVFWIDIKYSFNMEWYIHIKNFLKKTIFSFFGEKYSSRFLWQIY